MMLINYDVCWGNVGVLRFQMVFVREWWCLMVNIGVGRKTMALINDV